MGINGNNVKNTNSVEDFSNIILAALKEKFNAEYGFHFLFKNKTDRNKYGLFFVCKHILGAHKFLEACDFVEKELRTNSKQLSFEFTEKLNKPEIIKYLELEKEYTNCDLYEIGIKNHLLPHDIINQLKELENNIRITVIPSENSTRRKGAFYVDYKNWKEKNIKIYIKRIKTLI